MLMKIYLITTLISWLTFITFTKAIQNKLKREGYKIATNELSISEKIIDFIPTFFKLSFPIYNILVAIALFWIVDDKFYKDLKEEYVKRGLLHEEIKETSNKDNETKNEEIEEQITYSKDIQKSKTYSEMTLEEKLDYLEKEREYLMSQYKIQEENHKTRKRERL